MSKTWDNLLNMLLNEMSIIKYNHENIQFGDMQCCFSYIVFSYKKYYFYVITDIDKHYKDLNSNKIEKFNKYFLKIFKNIFLYTPYKKYDIITGETTLKFNIQSNMGVSDETKQRFEKLLPIVKNNIIDTERKLREVENFCEIESEKERFQRKLRRINKR